jgi:hypothetical protein
MFDIDDDRVSLIDAAITHKAGRDEILLFEEMSLAIELMNKENFDVVASNVTEGKVRFEISTKYPDGLPENVGMLFFNADRNFNVRVTECQGITDYDRRYFDILLQKL